MKINCRRSELNMYFVQDKMRQQSTHLQNFTLIILVLMVTLPGGHCVLISPVGPTLVNAIVGSNVTLAVSVSGAADPVVGWFLGSLPVVTWTIGSSASPDISDSYSKVLRIESDGSLTFLNAQLTYSGNYTIEITKSGVGIASATFTLKVYDYIQNGTLKEAGPAIEGHANYTLQYSILQGEVEQAMWYFNGTEIKTNSRFSIVPSSLVINWPQRNDTGQYTLFLANPFSSATAYWNLTVLYGPDEPVLKGLPAKPFVESGSSLSLSCQADGLPQPSVSWVFNGLTLPEAQKGLLNLTDAQTSQSGNYTCMLVNGQTGAMRQKNVTINIYERPVGHPLCSVLSSNNKDLQYSCHWSGGNPEPRLSFPALSNGSSGTGDLWLNMTASANLNGTNVTCVGDHPILQDQCSIAAYSPGDFLPSVTAIVDSNGKIVVTIHCVCDALPEPVVSWTNWSMDIISGNKYQISADTAELMIHDVDVSSSLVINYTCTCRNPLGVKTRNTQLIGPTISDSSMISKQNKTAIALTWDVPPTSVVTGFDVQMKGPDLINISQTSSYSKDFRSIIKTSGSTRSVYIEYLDPQSTYRFRVIPYAGITAGSPSQIFSIGPGKGLSNRAIVGIAAGVFLLMLFIAGLIYLCFGRYNVKRQAAKNPMSKAVEKAVATQPDLSPHPHNLLTGGLKPLPDCNQTLHEQSGMFHVFTPPPLVRTATTV